MKTKTLFFSSLVAAAAMSTVPAFADISEYDATNKKINWISADNAYKWVGSSSGAFSTASNWVTGTGLNGTPSWSDTNTAPVRVNNQGDLLYFDGTRQTISVSGTGVNSSDGGGIWVTGTGNTVTASLGGWAGSIQVEAGNVLNTSWSQQLKDGHIVAKGTVNVTSGDLNMDRDSARTWFVGADGSITFSTATTISTPNGTGSITLLGEVDTLSSGITNRTVSGTTTLTKQLVAFSSSTGITSGLVSLSVDTISTVTGTKLTVVGSLADLTEGKYYAEKTASGVKVSYVANTYQKETLTWAGTDSGTGSIWVNKGDNWTNSNGETTTFLNGDNATFNSDATVTVSPSGVTAGTVKIASGKTLTLTNQRYLSADSIDIAEGATLDLGTLGANVSQKLTGTGAVTFTSTHGNTINLGTEFAGTVNISGNLQLKDASFGASTATLNLMTGVHLWSPTSCAPEIKQAINFKSGESKVGGWGSATPSITLSGDLTFEGDASLYVAKAYAGEFVPVVLNITGSIKNATFKQDGDTLNISGKGTNSISKLTLSGGTTNITAGTNTITTLVQSGGALNISASTDENTTSTTITTANLTGGTISGGNIKTANVTSGTVTISGSTIGTLTQTGGTLNISDSATTVSNGTLSGGLTFSGDDSALVISENGTVTLSGTVSGATVGTDAKAKITVNSGSALTLDASSLIYALTGTDESINGKTLNIATGDGTISTTGTLSHANFTWNGSVISGRTKVSALTNGSVTFSGSAADLVWNGSVSNTWDTTTQNWTNGTSTDHFYTKDNVEFSAGQNVSVTFSENLTAGKVSIAGNVTLADSITGTLTGEIVVADGGTLTVNKGSSSGASAIRGSLTIESGGKASFSTGDVCGWSNTASSRLDAITVDSGGTLEINHKSNETFRGTLTLNGTLTRGASGGEGTVWDLHGGSAKIVTTVAGAKIDSGVNLRFRQNNSEINVGSDASLEIASVISDTVSSWGEGNGLLRKTGAGTLTLSGANTYSGGTNIEKGTLVAANASVLSTGAVSVAADAKLGLVANVTVSGVTGGITLAEGAKIVIDMKGVDMTDVSATETFTLDLITGTALTYGTTSITSDNADSTLKNVIEFSNWDESLTEWTLTFDDSDSSKKLSLSLTKIPEPSAFGLLAGVGALVFVAARRRRRAK